MPSVSAAGPHIDLGNVLFAAWPNRLRPIPEKLTVARCRFGVLIDGYQDRANVVIAPAFMDPDAPDFRQGFEECRIVLGVSVIVFRRFHIRYEDFDTLCQFADGLTGKCLGASQVKRFGIEKFFDALRGAGLRIRLEEDPEQTAKMLARIADNFNPRQANQARPNNSSHLSNKAIDGVLHYLANGKPGGLGRLNAAVKQARSNWARHAANASWKKKRAISAQHKFQAEG